MSPAERKARADAAHFWGLAVTTCPAGHVQHKGCLAVTMRLDEIAAERALEGLDLSLASLFAPTPGDALALRGEGP